MDEYIKLIADYGILIIIAAVFIWDKVTNAKMTESILKELQANAKIQASTLEGLKRTSENTSTALNIIQNTLASNSSAMERHDKRSEYMNNDIKIIRAMLEKKE